MVITLTIVPPPSTSTNGGLYENILSLGTITLKVKGVLNQEGLPLICEMTLIIKSVLFILLSFNIFFRLK